MLEKEIQPLPKYKFLKYHLPVILYALLIVSISSISNLKTPQIRFLAFDKIAHFFEYGIFALLAVRSFQNITDKITKNGAFLMTSLFIFIFATFDEYFVQRLSHRNSSVYDLIADAIGAHLLLLVVWIVQKPKKELKA